MQLPELEQRIADRIREQIGELMTDYDLRKIIHDTLKRTFIQPERSSWDGRQTTNRFEDLVRDILKPVVEQALKQWLADNRELLEAEIKRLVEAGAFGVVNRYLTGIIQSALSPLLPREV